nr:hypothetical protein [Tanacetum cinerariifolium]
DGEDVDVHTYRSMIGSLMYLTSSRPDIMFAVYACARFQVTPKVSHLNAVKRIFRYLKGKPYLGLWMSIPWMQIDFLAMQETNVVATSLTEAEYVAAASGCAQVLWIQNQLLDYGNVVIEIADILSDALPIITNGVNTPRSDGDRLKLMELMVFLLQKGKSDAAEGFEQIIDFLSGSYIHYALTVNPHIYISCIKQFWNTAFVKRSGDVTRLQALVDKKKIVISEMGYEKLSTKLNFYKAYFSSQWKFLIHTILQSLSAKRTSWNEFSTTMASAVICLSKGLGKVSQELRHLYLRECLLLDNLQRKEEENVAKNVAHDAIPSPPPHDIPSPSQEPYSPPQQPQSSPQAPPQGVEFPPQLQQVLNVCSALTRRVENLKNDNAAQKLVIIKLKVRVKRLEKANMVKSLKLRRLRKVGASKQVKSSDDMEDVFNQGRMIDDMDKDEGIELVKDADIAEYEGRHAAQQAEKQAKIYHIDLDHSSRVLKVVTAAASQVSAASVTIPAAKPSILTAAPTVVAAYTIRRKGVIIRDLKEELSSKTPAETPKVKDKGKEINRDEFNKDIDWDAAMDHVNQNSNNPQYIKRYQGIKKRPQTDSEARKNMMIYLKNAAGYKMDFFKGMTYAQICRIFQARFDENMRFLFKSSKEMKEEDQEVIKRINETPAQKAAKRRKLSEEAQEAEDLRKRLEVVDDEDDDVFIEATPLARKVPVVDYQIVLTDNKPRFKIIKADETHQLYISFTTLLKNFDREDLENLWRIASKSLLILIIAGGISVKEW